MIIIHCLETIAVMSTIVFCINIIALNAILLITFIGWIFDHDSDGYEKIHKLFDKCIDPLIGGKQNVESKYKR